MKNFGMSESRSNKTKGIDMDKCKIRSWLKDDFSTLAKYLNNKRYGIIAVIVCHILTLKAMLNNLSNSF